MPDVVHFCVLWCQVPPSPNNVGDTRLAHWYAVKDWLRGSRRKGVRGAKEELAVGLIQLADRYALLQDLGAPHRVRLRITLFYGGNVRQRDAGNVVTSCKPLIDQLKLWKGGKRGPTGHGDPGLGLLFDDSPEWLDDEYASEKVARHDPRIGRVRIEVTRLEEQAKD